MMFWYGNSMSGWGMRSHGLRDDRVLSLDCPCGNCRHPSARQHSAAAITHSGASEQLLAQRLARGEIDEDEYQRTLRLLQARHHPGPEGR